MYIVNISDDGEPPPLSTDEVDKIVSHALKPSISDYVLSLHFTDDNGSRRLHRRFFNIDSPTDVMTFDLGDDISPGGNEEPDGEIVINLNRAKRQAKKRKIPYSGECALYLVHGLFAPAGVLR